MSFKSFLLTEQQKKTFVFTFGRYNPPTKGHINHFTAVKNYAQANGADYKVYTSQTVDNKKNPLTSDEKISYIKKAVPDINIQPAKNMFAILEEIIAAGIYDNVVYFAGGDYFEDPQQRKLFDRMTEYAAKNNISVEAIQSGARAEGISGTALRSAVRADDFQTFLSASPSGVSERDVRTVFEIVKQRLQ